MPAGSSPTALFIARRLDQLYPSEHVEKPEFSKNFEIPHDLSCSAGVDRADCPGSYLSLTPRGARGLSAQTRDQRVHRARDRHRPIRMPAFGRRRVDSQILSHRFRRPLARTDELGALWRRRQLPVFERARALRPNAGVRVPKVEAVSGELGVILLEDLGDLTLERKFWENQTQDSALEFYDQTVDQLIKIHFGASNAHAAASLCQTTQFDTPKFMWEMNYAANIFLEKLGRVQLSERDQQILQREF